MSATDTKPVGGADTVPSSKAKEFGEPYGPDSTTIEDANNSEYSEEARLGAEEQQNLRPLDAIKAYPMALFWSLMISMTVVMEGYDTILITNFFAFKQFAKKYGEPSTEGEGDYQLTAQWQAGLVNGAQVGAFFGTLLNGILVNKFGQKRVIIYSLVVLSACIPLTFWAQNLPMLLCGQLLCGLPWGVFATIAPAYASEVLPMALRVYLSSYTNMAFIIGQLIAAGVLAGLDDLENEWAFRIPFALQWVWPAFLIPILCFAPESPWHLVRKRRYDEAEKSLKRLVKKSSKINVRNALAVIIHTNSLEEKLAIGTSYWDCFKGFERRRTEIACMTFGGQVLSGLMFAYNSTYFFQQVGVDENIIYELNVGGTGMALFGTLISWFFLMPYFGRRTIYVIGMGAMTTLLFIIGILESRSEASGIGMTQAVLTLVWTFVFQLSAGQLGWAIPSEIGSTRLRQKTICVARNFYYICAIIANVLQPHFMNPTEWNIRGYCGFFWGGTAFLTFIWAFFRLPESKDRSFEELDVLFARGVSARKFKTTQVEIMHDDEAEHIATGATGARPSTVESKEVHV